MDFLHESDCGCSEEVVPTEYSKAATNRWCRTPDPEKAEFVNMILNK